MATFTHIDEAEVRALTRAYNLGQLHEFSAIPEGSVNSNFALRAGGARFFLRIYEEQPRAGAELETRLLAHLAQRGVPTPSPLRRADGALVADVQGKPAALFPWIDGQMRCQASVTAEDCGAVGAALAHVHASGRDAQLPNGRFHEGDLAVRLDRIGRAADAELAAHAVPLAAALSRWSAARDRTLPRGLVHGDLFRDNVLWNGQHIAALLDFESASAGVFAYDLMVTVLAWCVGAAPDWGLARALVKGYAAVRPLEEAECQGLLAEGCMAAIRFSITRITDYAMRDGIGPRVNKDHRRFLMRLDALEKLGPGGLRDALQV